MENQVKVGVGVMVLRRSDNKVLLGKRLSSHGSGEYSWPGGHLEYLESIEACAKREVFEETGLEIDSVQFLRLLNLKSYSPKHYVDIGLIAFVKHGTTDVPKTMEPNKCEGWNWYDIDNLPHPQFSGIDSFIESYRTGKSFYDN